MPLRIGCLLLIPLLCPSTFAVTRYTVTLSDPERHLIRVTMELPPGSATRELQLPVWNALYQIRDFVQFIINIGAKDPDRNPLPMLQVNKSRWLLQGAGNGAKVEYVMFSESPGPFGAELNSQHAFFNLAQILLYTDDTRAEPDEITFQNVPAQWKIATPLTQKGNSYKATNYDELVDSPVEMGIFEERDFDGRCGKYRVVVDAENANNVLGKIVPPIQHIVAAATDWMNDCPFQTYTFIYHFSDSPNSGGMEHAYGTAIAMSARNLNDGLDRFTAITTHEFVHLWDVKRIRPQSLEPVDYTKENYTNALWFSEGVDTTAADYIRLHAGLVDERHYLDHVSQAITELENEPARLTQSAEQSSIDAWLEKYPYYGLPDRSISYYNKGELLGVLLDLKMREATQGRVSLQTLLRWMNENYAKQAKFFADSDGVRDAAEKLTGANFRDFFSDYVSGVQEIPWNTYFAAVGLRSSTVEAIYPDLGFDGVQKFDQPPTVVRVQAGSPAERASLKVDDVILAINDKPAGRNFEQQMNALGPGDVLHLRVRRGGAPLELQWTLGSRKMTVYRLDDLPTITQQQRAQRKAWLFGDSIKSTQ